MNNSGKCANCANNDHGKYPFKPAMISDKTLMLIGKNFGQQALWNMSANEDILKCKDDIKTLAKAGLHVNKRVSFLAFATIVTFVVVDLRIITLEKKLNDTQIELAKLKSDMDEVDDMFDVINSKKDAKSE